MEIEEHPLQDANPSDLDVEEDDTQDSAQESYSPLVKLAVVSEANKLIAHEIAKALQEVERVPIQQIGRIVEVLGEATARELLAEALKVEEAGGMLTNSGDRRRTPGGVYFYLAKGRLTPEQRGQVFPHLAPRNVPSLSWEDRHEHVKALLASEPNDRRLKTAIIQLRGFVADWKRVENSYILKMVYSHRGDIPLPRAVPTPPVGSLNTFIVYVGYRHWEKVQKIVTTNSDALVVEGIPFIDQETNSLAVLALFVTGRGMLPNEKRELIGDFAEAEMLPKPTRQEQKRQAEAKKAAASSKPSPSSSKIPAVKPASKQSKAAPTPPTTSKPKQESVAEAAPTAPPVFTVPSGAPADVAAKLQQLHQAAHTLRERIATMEAKNQPGVAMTRKLLENTEKQIETLIKQYT